VEECHNAQKVNITYQGALIPSAGARAVLFGRGLDTSHGLGFLRERMTLVGKKLFLVSFGFYLFLLASMVPVGGAPFIAVVVFVWG
jgi:hypothetical protein